MCLFLLNFLQGYRFFEKNQTMEQVLQFHAS